ncbi:MULTISPECIES: hypothetical protein [Exiguobacterium]|uniref:DUF2187 domain-containing protein n=1 Tax=Exiguobacterium undae TaxID=169177 RepID=A0ABX2VAC6_9BACL|nr:MULTISPECIES: hypothetical protein [Exiguobacterium]OAN15191.1 hypothetical protein A3783_04400 [Exiguobacterium undae]
MEEEELFDYIVGDMVKTKEGWVAEVTAVLTNTVVGDLSHTKNFESLGFEFEKQVLIKSEIELLERKSK